jgi:hypothetical protein
LLGFTSLSSEYFLRANCPIVLNAYQLFKIKYFGGVTEKVVNTVEYYYVLCVSVAFVGTPKQKREKQRGAA